MTIEEMIRKYDIVIVEKDGEKKLAIRNVTGVKRDGMFDEIKANKESIIASIEEEQKKKIEAFRVRQGKINAIPGLKEIKEAKEKVEKFHIDFNRAMDRGDGILPVYPSVDVEALMEEYPQAAAYIKAEKESLCSNYELAEIGGKALERVINGDWEKAIEDMEKEISEFVERHCWD